MASRSLCRVFALMLLLCLWLAPEAWAQPSPFDVLGYNTRVDIETSGDIIVTEDITVYIPTEGTNKGIIRDIPINPRWRDQGRQEVKLTVEAVSIDGNPCRTDDTEMTYPVLSIYMRDRAHYLSRGRHVFHLRYRMSEQIGFFDEGDELTWNAVGEGWGGGVHQARATVFPPAGTNFTQERAWLGKRGSHDAPVRIRRELIEGREALVFEPQRPISGGEAFTVAVGWPSGIVEPPLFIEPEDQWGYTLTYAGCFLVSLAAAWGLWARLGRDPEGGPVIPHFYPPKVPERLRAASNKAVSVRKGKAQRLLHGEEYMTPVAVHYVHEGGKLEERGLAALLLSLAQRGDCRLMGSAQDKVVVVKLGNTSPAPEESAAASKLPERITLSERKSTNSPIGKMYDACKLRLDFDYPMVVEWKLWQQVVLFFSLAFVLSFVALSQLGDSPSELVYEELSASIVGASMLAGGLAGIAYLIHSMRREGGFSSNYLSGFIFFGMLMIPGVLAFDGVDLFWIYSPLQLSLMLATLLPPVVFGFLMDMPSREQVELRQHIKGLALYIGTAEAERFNTFNPPEEDLQLYLRLLPYAVALGLEEAWGQRFADKLARALGSEKNGVDWDISVSMRDLVRGSRVSLGTYREAVFAEQAARYASSTGGGSSFGGFGGGAGSGGGGGGGRAC